MRTTTRGSIDVFFEISRFREFEKRALHVSHTRARKA